MIKCELFSKCGGCNLYKLQDSEYKIYKEQYLKNILFEMPENIFLGMKFPNGKRRRVNLKLDYGVNLGFFKENTNDVVSLKFCPLVADEINNIISPLKQLLKTFTKRSCGEVQITLADNGPIIHFNNIHIMKNDISKIKTFAETNNIILISAGGKNIDNITDSSNIILYQKQVPFVTFNDIQIPLPATSFLQVSKESEIKIVDTVLKEVSNLGINKKLKIIDLFCGLGLFSFYLYDIAEYITAIDCEKESILNINKTAKERQISIIAKVQNLFSKPVKSKDLNNYDLIVYDPPRQAAINQITEIASSNVPYIIYVSCNPVLFKRDAEILIKSGYKIKNITQIDQFPLTYHIELVVVFIRI